MTKVKVTIIAEYDLEDNNYPNNKVTAQDKINYDFNKLSKNFNYIKKDKFKATINMDMKIDYEDK